MSKGMMMFTVFERYAHNQFFLFKLLTMFRMNVVLILVVTFTIAGEIKLTVHGSLLLTI